MLTNLLKFTGISALLGGLYIVNYNPLCLRGELLKQTFSLLQQYKPQYSQPLLKALIRYKMLAKEEALQNYILERGFDIQGYLLQGLLALGLKGVEVGPTSFLPSQQQQPQFCLGINHLLANICSFRNNHSQPFYIEMNIVPNYQIIKFTPYLIKENIIQAFANFAEIQKKINQNLIQNITIQYDRPTISLQNQNTPEFISMIKELKASSKLIIDQVNLNRQSPITISFNPQRTKFISSAKLINYIIGKQTI